MINKKRYRKDGLVSKVWDFQPTQDEKGKHYVPFCTYKHHVGISLFHEVCEKRGCYHYRKLYVSLQD